MPCGPFTLPQTDTGNENKYTQPNGNMCFHLSLCSEDNSTQSYKTPFFICLSIGLGVGQCKHTLNCKAMHLYNILYYQVSLLTILWFSSVLLCNFGWTDTTDFKCTFASSFGLSKNPSGSFSAIDCGLCSSSSPSLEVLGTTPGSKKSGENHVIERTS